MQQKLIQYNFNASAATYMQYAAMQKPAAQKIIHQLPTYHNQGYILDLGSGPGTLLHAVEYNYPGILYDLSLNMLKAEDEANQSRQNLRINGDAAYLPFATGSISTTISNLMLQWSEDKLQVLNEIKRVLTPDGIFMFTTLIMPSLWQLQQAWKRLDRVSHTLDFLVGQEYKQLLQRAGLGIIHNEIWESTFYFPDIYTLLQHFKLTGTTMPKSNLGSGLSTKRLFNDLADVYPKHPSNLTFPLSYQYLFIIAKNV